MTRRLVAALALASAVYHLGGCEPAPRLTADALRRPSLAALEWPDTVVQHDSVVLRIQVVDHAGAPLARVFRTEWMSPGAVFRADASGLQAWGLFRRRGTAVVRVMVEPGAAYPPLEGADTLMVRTSWIALGTGHDHSCGVAADQTFYCWGLGAGGRTSGVPAGDTVAPARVVLQSESVDNLALDASAGAAHTCALMADGTARCMGENSSGQVGNGTTVRTRVDSRVEAGATTRYASIAAGAAYTCAVTTDRAVNCWGANDAGQLGLALAPQRCGDAAYPCAPLPQRVPDLPEMARVSAGAEHACAVSVLERVYCWGESRYGATGALGVRAPHRVDADVLLAAVAAGGRHTCALSPGGGAYCWGADDRGQLGSVGMSESCAGVRCSPRPLPVSAGIGFISISSGEAHTCAVATSGRVYCWGSNEHGQLGSPPVSDGGCDGVPCARTPVPVATGIRFRSVSAGAAHTCAISVDRQTYCWGRNVHGQLGRGSREPSGIPVVVTDAF